MTSASSPISSPARDRTARSTLHSVAPLVTVGTAWVIRKGMIKAFEARTGRPAPVVHSQQSPMIEKVLWAAAMAAVITLIEVTFWQILGEDAPSAVEAGTVDSPV